MRIYFPLIVAALLFGCRQECLLDECGAYLSEAQVIFQPGTVYGPGEVLRGLFQPTVVSTSEGSLLVFAQGRINTSEDNADKVLILSRSEDRQIQCRSGNDLDRQCRDTRHSFTKVFRDLI